MCVFCVCFAYVYVCVCFWACIRAVFVLYCVMVYGVCSVCELFFSLFLCLCMFMRSLRLSCACVFSDLLCDVACFFCACV